MGISVCWHQSTCNRQENVHGVLDEFLQTDNHKKNSIASSHPLKQHPSICSLQSKEVIT